MSLLTKPIKLSSGKKTPWVKKGAGGARNHPKIALSLDIGSCSTKMLVGRQRPSGLYIEQAMAASTPESAFNDGGIANPPALTEMLTGLAAKDKSNTLDLFFTIESTKIIKRELTIPHIPDEDIPGLAAYEMMQYLPIEISEYSIQHKVIGPAMEDGQEKISVSVSAVPKSIIQSYQQLFTAAGLRPVSMNTNSNSVEKLLQSEMKRNPANGYADKNVVFVDMGHACFNVSVYENGKYQFNRTIETGGRLLDAAMAKLLEVSEKRARSVKREVFTEVNVEGLERKYGGRPPEFKPRTDYEATLIDMLSIINQWAAQVDKVLQYMTRSRGKNIDKMYLYGGCSMIKGISAFFEKRLSIRTEAVGALSCCEYSPSVNPQSIIPTHWNAIGSIIA